MAVTLVSADVAAAPAAPALLAPPLASATAAASDERGEEAVLLEPYLVKARASGGKHRGAAALAEYAVGGNLDLLRTENDVLPFTIFEREQIFRSGAGTLDEFLRRELLDAVASGPTGAKPGTPGFSSLVADATALRLRGYAADETVILVNGRRLPESVSSGSNASPESANVNLIPLSLVERIEVLPVSASALYSGNPVGGVINIVLRANVDVTELTAHVSNATQFDAPQSTFSLLHGQTLLNGRLRVRLNATRTSVFPASESELGYIQANLRTQPGGSARIYRATPNVRSPSGVPLFGAGTAAITSVAPGADGTGDRAAYLGRMGLINTMLFDSPGALAYSPNSLDFGYGQHQVSESYFASATFDVFPRLQLGIDVMFSDTVVNRGYDVFTGDLKMAANSPLNPFGAEVVVALNEIAPLLGENYSEANRRFSSLVLGALLRLPAEWSVSLDTQQAQNLTRYRGLAGVDARRWQELVDRALYNPLRDTQRFGPPAEFYEQALIYTGGRGLTVSLGDYSTWDTALRLTNRSLRFPTGGAAVNMGGDFRVTELRPYTDEQRYGDGSYAAAPIRWRGRTLQRLSAFGELQAPLLPSRWLPRGVKEIEATVAARYTVADSTQETNVAPTGGLKIALAGGFGLRAAVATSNRMPTPLMAQKVALPVLRASSVGTASFVPVFDPRRGERYGVQASDAINPNLRPESAVTQSAGIMFERRGEHRLRAATDFVDTRKSGELIYLDPQTLLNLESLFPGRVTRAPVAPGDSHDVGPVTSVLRGNFNLAWRHSQNVNTTVDYAWTECRGGTLEIYARWIAFHRYDRQLLPTSPLVDQLRQPDGTSAGLLRNRMSLGGGWSNRRYGFRFDGHFYAARMLPIAEWRSQGSSQVDPYWQVDASLQRELPGLWLWRNRRGGLQAQLRVDNLLGARPPHYANDPTGAGVQAYRDWRRQTYSLSLRASF